MPRRRQLSPAAGVPPGSCSTISSSLLQAPSVFMPTSLPLQPGSWSRPVTDDEGSSGRQRYNVQGDFSFLMEAIKPFNYFTAALFVSRQFPTSTRQPAKSCVPHSQLINQGGESTAAQVFLADPAQSTTGRGDGVTPDSGYPRTVVSQHPDKQRRRAAFIPGGSAPASSSTSASGWQYNQQGADGWQHGL